MINKIMIDSSLLVEFIKGGKKDLLVSLINNAANECYINETIVSEFLFHFLAINGKKSPKAIQSAKAIPDTLRASYEYILIESFLFLPTNESLFSLVPELMLTYNLLPNDAIILATCKIHGIQQLASYDTDFIIACKGEGIVLLQEV